MKCYLAGPMRGYKDFNFPEFLRVGALLESVGFEVFNPAKRDLEAHGAEVFESPEGDLADIAHLGFDLREALGADLAFICAEADALFTLPGWEHSSGAKAEVATAKALGIPVLHTEGELP